MLLVSSDITRKREEDGKVTVGTKRDYEGTRQISRFLSYMESRFKHSYVNRLDNMTAEGDSERRRRTSVIGGGRKGRLAEGEYQQRTVTYVLNVTMKTSFCMLAKNNN